MEPPAFGHRNLPTTASGEGLSKRLGYHSLRGLREAGVKIAGRYLSRDMRYPIVNGFSDTGESMYRPNATLVSGIG